MKDYKSEALYYYQSVNNIGLNNKEYNEEYFTNTLVFLNDKITASKRYEIDYWTSIKKALLRQFNKPIYAV